MDPFDAIFLDTNILINGKWPRLSDLFTGVLTLADQLRLNVYVPVPVEREVEMVWLRKLFNDRKDGSFEERTEGVVAAGRFSTPWGAIGADYRRTAAAIIAKWHINRDATVPFAGQSMEQAFQESISQDPPYNSRPGEFRDIVIYLSVAEFLMGKPTRGVLVSDDERFSGFMGSREKAWRDTKRVKLRMICQPESQSLATLLEELKEIQKTRDTAEIREWRQIDEARAKAALERDHDRLLDFILRKLEKPPSFRYELIYPSITKYKVGDVTTTAQPGMAEGSPVQLTAEITASFSAFILESLAPGSVNVIASFYPAAAGFMPSRFEGTPTTFAVTPTFYPAGAGLTAPGFGVTPTTFGVTPTSQRRAIYLGDAPFLFQAFTGRVIVKAHATLTAEGYHDLGYDSALLLDWNFAPRSVT